MIDIYKINKENEIYKISFAYSNTNNLIINLVNEIKLKDIEYNSNKHTIKNMTTNNEFEAKGPKINKNLEKTEQIKKKFYELISNNIDDLIQDDNISFKKDDYTKISNQDINLGFSKILLPLKESILKDFYYEYKEEIFKHQPQMVNKSDEENLDTINKNTYINVIDMDINMEHMGFSLPLQNITKSGKDLKDLEKILNSFNVSKESVLGNKINTSNLEDITNITNVSYTKKDLFSLLENENDPKYVEAFKNGFYNVLMHELSHSLIKSDEIKAVSLQTKDTSYSKYKDSFNKDKDINMFAFQTYYIEKIIHSFSTVPTAESLELSKKFLNNLDKFLFNAETVSDPRYFSSSNRNEESKDNYYIMNNEYLDVTLGENIINANNFSMFDKFKVSDAFIDFLNIDVNKSKILSVHMNMLLYAETLNLSENELDLLKYAISKQIYNDYLIQTEITNEISNKEKDVLFYSIFDQIEKLSEKAHDKYIDFKENNKLDQILNIDKNTSNEYFNQNIKPKLTDLHFKDDLIKSEFLSYNKMLSSNNLVDDEVKNSLDR